MYLLINMKSFSFGLYVINKGNIMNRCRNILKDYESEIIIIL